MQGNMSTKEIIKSAKRAVWLAALNRGGPVHPLTYSDITKSRYGTPKEKSSIKMCLDFDKAHCESWWNDCSGDAEYSRNDIKRFINSIDSGINWSITEEMKDNMGYKFNGTDQEGNDIPVVIGVLYTNDGEAFPWVANFDTNLTGLKDLLAFIAEWENQSDELVLKHIKEKFIK